MSSESDPPLSPSPSDDPSLAGSPRLEIDGRLATLVFDDESRSLNVLTQTVLETLGRHLDTLSEGAAAGRFDSLLILSGKSGHFMAGADIDAIAAIENPLEGERGSKAGQAVFLRLERLDLATVAAIDGSCLGGGTELALACRYRVVSDASHTKISLPEVQLGILPAWGGTTRLPRLVGLQAALPLLLTGTAISGRKAQRIGFAQELLPGEAFAESAAAFARTAHEIPRGTSRPKRSFLKRLGDDTAPGRRAILMAAKKQVLAQTKGHYPAPLRILEHLRRHLGGPLGKSFDAEARTAGELLVSSVSKNLLHVFRMRERAKKSPTRAAASPVSTVAVVGAGVMGGGIAQLAAYNGLRVRMKDIRHEAVAHGLQHAREIFDKAVKRKKLRSQEADQKMELISGGLEYHGFQHVDVVVEAVVERMDVKKSVLKETERATPDNCILTTNTSSLSVNEMATALQRPERFAGLHFFNPVHRMPLVEIVRGKATSDETLATLHRFVLDLGKVPVVCADGPGFLVNRILGPYLNEAGWLLTEGATVEAVDHAASQFGMPMGPLRLIDEIGIDIAIHAGATLASAFGDRMMASPVLSAMGDSERLGRKTNRGFYLYEGGKPTGVDPSVYKDLGPLAAPAGKGAPGEEVIRTRLVLAMINEAARALEDSVVSLPHDVDLAMIMGAGFPPFRGGLLRFADTLHARHIVSRLEDLAKEHPRFAPAELLLEHARLDRGFYTSPA